MTKVCNESAQCTGTEELWKKEDERCQAGGGEIGGAQAEDLPFGLMEGLDPEAELLPPCPKTAYNSAAFGLGTVSR